MLRNLDEKAALLKYERIYWRNIFLFVLGPLILVCITYSLLPSNGGHAEASRDSRSKNNLKLIGLAVHNYHDVSAVFPPAQIHYSNDSEHGWGFLLLPYLDMLPLYNSIHSDQSWKHSINIKAYSTQVECYLNPKFPDHELLDNYAVNQYAGNSRVFVPEIGMPISSIIDGTSNTLLAGEVSTGFKAWGDPTNVRDPAAGLKNDSEHFCGKNLDPLMLFADGSVRRIRADINMETLRKLADPMDGEIVGEF